MRVVNFDLQAARAPERDVIDFNDTVVWRTDTGAGNQSSTTLNEDVRWIEANNPTLEEIKASCARRSESQPPPPPVLQLPPQTGPETLPDVYDRDIEVARPVQRDNRPT